jgi:hypothetical protein
MTKLTPVLVCTVHPINQVPESERSIVRRVLTENIQGVNEQHHRRWLRVLRRLFTAEPGECHTLYPDVERSRPFHCRWMAIEQRVFDNQDAYVNQDRFRDWLKTGAGLGEYRMVGEHLKFCPGSLSYESASDDEMREFAASATAFLRTPRAQKKLWPHLSAQRRAEMVETLMRDPKQQEGA